MNDDSMCVKFKEKKNDSAQSNAIPTTTGKKSEELEQ